MRRRDLLKTAALAVAAASGPARSETRPIRRLIPPAKGRIPVAVLLSAGAQVIDFAGPWEVFQDVQIPERGRSEDEQAPFQLFTVAERTEPIRASGGMRVIPDYDFSSAPAPKIIVIPAQSRPTEATREWLRTSAKKTDVTMSVCTGAFVLGAAGMLSGQAATTHHDFYDRFARSYPEVELKRGVRFVENETISTAGGLTSGIDLALHVVERYFGRDVAQRTASYMEHESDLWRT